MGIYEDLGVRPIINAAGELTRLSGTPVHPEVAEAEPSETREERRPELATRYLTILNTSRRRLAPTDRPEGILAPYGSSD